MLAPLWPLVYHWCDFPGDSQPLLFWGQFHGVFNICYGLEEPLPGIEVLSRPRSKIPVKANERIDSKDTHFTRPLPCKWAAVVEGGICLSLRPGSQMDGSSRVRTLSPHCVACSPGLADCGFQCVHWHRLPTQHVQTAGFLAVHPVPRYSSEDFLTAFAASNISEWEIKYFILWFIWMLFSRCFLGRSSDVDLWWCWYFLSIASYYFGVVRFNLVGGNFFLPSSLLLRTQYLVVILPVLGLDLIIDKTRQKEL